jgi:cobalt-zinc-cadmium resistance protein CzcA
MAQDLRLGATTKDGEGEVVGAIALMLMKENSLHVSEAVHLKLEELKKTLPEGIIVETYYDRAAMVNTTIKTVLKNLAEGALVCNHVVLFLLLGSVRAGLGDCCYYSTCECYLRL